jgi:hypothetical protein
MLRKKTLKTFVLCMTLLWIESNKTYAQTASASNNLVAQPIADRLVPFDITDPGTTKTVQFGFDTAWLSEGNAIRASRFMGKDQVDLVRVSYEPSYPLINGDLQQPQINLLNQRLSYAQAHAKSDAEIVMNVAADQIDTTSYYGNATNWKNLIKATAIRIENAGYSVVSVGPMNEPDCFCSSQGSTSDFYNIVAAMRADSYFDNIRISAGNTLAPDNYTTWYTPMIDAGVDEGNTHQLDGTFDNYAGFFQQVKSNGHVASNDELHNVMEALVGYEYGMETGIWWGSAELARGEMVKAFDGERIGYAEHRFNWTAAAVYRAPDGKVLAFGGVSERQARSTNYNFISKDRAVYFDGHGPQHDFVLQLPADPNGEYQTVLQRNAERVINITWGDDIQPVIDGQYKIVNQNSSLVIEVNGSGNGANVRQNSYTGSDNQKWNVTPVPMDIGGDFSYYHVKPVSNTSMSLDVNNFSLNNGDNIQQWTTANNSNQQWYFDYDGDAWFYIRNRESSYCVDVFGANMNPGGNITQWEKNGGTNQKWRLLPIDAPIEFDRPSAPTNLMATAYATSVKLDWTVSPESDVTGYTIFRSKTKGGPYNTIARNVSETSFMDNTTLIGQRYFYVVKAVDYSLNSSETYSNETSETPTGNDDLVASYQFEDNTLDSSINLNHSAPFGDVLYTTGHNGGKAISLTSKFLQLPPNIANHEEITVATWFNWDIKNNWQRIFDFGNGTDEFMFLTPRNGANQLQFSIKYNGVEQSLTAPVISSGEWLHVAVTLGTTGAALYVNGVEVAASNAINISPLDFKPVLNYIGRSQYSDPLIYGYVDDFRVYNYVLAPNEVAALASTLSVEDSKYDNILSIYPVPSKDVLYIKINNQIKLDQSTLTIFDLNGRALMEKILKNNENIAFDVSNLASGMYILSLNSASKSVVKKFVVSH